MPLQRFIPSSSDRYISNDKNQGAVKFGHLNAVVDYINSSVIPDGLQLEGDGPLTSTPRYITDNSGNLSSLAISSGNIGIGTDNPTARLTVNGNINFDSYNRTLADGTYPLSLGHIISLRSTTSIYDGGGQGIYFKDSGGSAYAKMGFGNLNTTIGQSTLGVVPDLGARLGVRGSGSTSATTSLLVQNSSGTQALKVSDDLQWYLGTNTSSSAIHVPRDSGYGYGTFLKIAETGHALLATISNAGLLILINAISLPPMPQCGLQVLVWS